MVQVIIVVYLPSCDTLDRVLKSSPLSDAAWALAQGQAQT
jgi:hypothetical protein